MATALAVQQQPMQMQEVEPRPLWRNRNYMLLWTGQMVSSLGSNVSRIAFPLLVLAITRSPAQAGITGALAMVPYLFFSLPAGALVDRWDRKRVMIICDSGRALTLASISLVAALGHLSIMQLYVTSLIEGTFFVFFSLSEAACLPRVVPREQLRSVLGCGAGVAALCGSAQFHRPRHAGGRDIWARPGVQRGTVFVSPLADSRRAAGTRQ